MGGHWVSFSSYLEFSSYLVFSHINLNSITNKVNYVTSLIFDNKIDILCVSESWLNCNIFDSTIGVGGYNVVRADSPTGIRKHGVLICIKNGISYSEIGIDIPNVLVLYLPNHDIYVMCIYRPPSSGLNDNVKLLEFIEQFCQDKEIIILGDFNLPSLHWNHENMLATYIPEFEMEFFNVFSVRSCAGGKFIY